MTVKETFEAMASRFRPERAQGLKAVIQYDITGPGGLYVSRRHRRRAVRASGRAAPRHRRRSR